MQVIMLEKAAVLFVCRMYRAFASLDLLHTYDQRDAIPADK